MPYIPHSEREIKEMLDKIEVSSIEDLFSSVPLEFRKDISFNIPDARTPFELQREMESTGNKNLMPDPGMHFLGAGIYNHWVPPLIDEIVSRQEFYTAYTPYQPEVSQGTLTAVFEYQTMISELTGLPISNASLYDGATGLAESILLAMRYSRRNTVAISKNIHPEYRKVVDAYLIPAGFKIIDITYHMDSGELDRKELKRVIKETGEDLACVVAASPNFFGIVEDLESIKKEITDTGILFIVTLSEALSLALLNPPGRLGADIVTGEAASFGNYMNFGGPTLGFIAVKEELLRNLPGRVCGQTKDKDGVRGFVFTLSTREQHIRRERATSNICSNQNLLAIRAAIYLAYMGKNGLRDIAEISASRAKYAHDKLKEIDDVSIKFDSSFFNEFVIEVPDAANLHRKLSEDRIAAGLLMKRFFPEYRNSILLSFTELNHESDIDKLVNLILKYIS